MSSNSVAYGKQSLKLSEIYRWLRAKVPSMVLIAQYRNDTPKGCCVSKGRFVLWSALSSAELSVGISLQLGLFRWFTAVSAYEAHASLNNCSPFGDLSFFWSLASSNYLFYQAQLCIYNTFSNGKSGDWEQHSQVLCRLEDLDSKFLNPHKTW